MKNASAPLHPAKMTAMLRAGVLAITPEEIGLSAADCPPVWGILMEFAEAEVVISLAALADGSVSIYLSDGAGVIGCGLHPDVRLAAVKLLQTAEQATHLCAPTHDYPQPEVNQVCMYLLTDHGILCGAAARQDLDAGVAGLAEVYYAGHALIGMVELLAAGVDLIDEMQLAENANREDVEAAAEGAPELKTKGRRCRILPYVSQLARRSQN
jgi:hypothetical protein